MQYVTLEDTVYCHFALNGTDGNGSAMTGDAAGTGTNVEPHFFVRQAGDAPSAAPVYYGYADLLTHALYPQGCYECAVPAQAANGFAADKTYAVFCTATVSAVNPTGMVGQFRTAPPAPLDAAKGTKFRRAVDGIVQVTVGGSATTTSVPTSACSPAGAAASQFIGRVLVFDANTATAALRGVAATVTASTNAATPTLTVSPALPAAPASGDTATIN